MSSKLCKSWSSQDQLLEDLVIRLEETEQGVGLTLCVNGLIIAGDITSSKKYFDRMSTFFGEFNYYRGHRFDRKGTSITRNRLNNLHGRSGKV
jgi:hypothetical protein